MTPFRIALPKGRLQRRALELFGASGLLSADGLKVGRRLVIPVSASETCLQRPLELLLLKNADVPTYVENGVADVGICGTDVLDESGAEVYRPYTFAFGRCTISLAARRGVTLAELRRRDSLRIATKYTRTARGWFASQRWNADLIHLNGSVELGAVLGLADAIVDLVETGTTLRENDLVALQTIGTTQVKLVANRALSRRGAQLLEELVAVIEASERRAAASSDTSLEGST